MIPRLAAALLSKTYGTVGVTAAPPTAAARKSPIMVTVEGEAEDIVTRVRERVGTDITIPYDPPLDRPERPCSHCARAFQPTARRRLLCRACFRHATDAPVTYVLPRV